MSVVQEGRTVRRKGRSPNYPGISLDVAIQRAGELYATERQHPAPVTTVARHWNYKSLNGPASVTLAALKKFGLLEDEGSGEARVARISDAAVEILANPDPDRKRAAIKDAALRPDIHREMWEKYGAELPSDATMQWELTRERGFTETGAAEFIREYKATLAFARLDEVAPTKVHVSDSDAGRATEREEVHDDDAIGRGTREGTRQVLFGTPRRAFPIPLIGGSVVVVEGEFPISRRDWDQFMAVLEAMKPGLVASDTEKLATGPDGE